MAGMAPTQLCRPSFIWIDKLNSPARKISTARPAQPAYEMDSVFDRFHRAGHGSGVGARVYTRDENSGVCLCHDCFRLSGRYVFWIIVIPRRSSEKIRALRGGIAFDSFGRRLSSHRFE